MKGLKNLLISGVIIASAILPGKLNAQIHPSNYNSTPITQVTNWKSDKPYWDMPVNSVDSVDSLDMQASRSLKKHWNINLILITNQMKFMEKKHVMVEEITMVLELAKVI